MYTLRKLAFKATQIKRTTQAFNIRPNSAMSQLIKVASIPCAVVITYAQLYKVSIAGEAIDPAPEEYYEKYGFSPNPYEGVEHIEYSQKDFCKERKLDGICLGAAIFQVVEKGHTEEKALKIQQKHNDINARFEHKWDDVSLDSYAIKQFNLYRDALFNELSSRKKIQKYHATQLGAFGPENSVDLIKKEITHRKAEHLSDLRYGNVFLLVYVLAGGYGHATRFEILPDTDRCSFYDANYGKDTGPCDKIIELYRQNLFKKYNRVEERVSWHFTRNLLDYLYRHEAKCADRYSIFARQYYYQKKDYNYFQQVYQVRMFKLAYLEKEKGSPAYENLGFSQGI